MKRAGIIASVGVVVGFLVLWAAIWGFRWITADPIGRLGARETILSGEFRVAAYQHFFNACAAVQGLEAGLDAQRELLGQTDGKDRQRVLANIAGITAEWGRAVAKYNADARKDYTEGQFRDLDLPYQLQTIYKEGGRTSCGVR